MKKNTLAFLIWAIIMTIVLAICADPGNFLWHPFMMLSFMSTCFYMPLIVLAVLNKIASTRKTERAKKILKVFIIVANIILGLWAICVSLLICCAVSVG